MLKNSYQNIPLNEEICEFIGAFIGDGYLGNYGKKKDLYVIGITGDQKLDEEYLKNYLKPLLKRNFSGINPLLYYRNDENTLMLRVNSKELYKFLLKIGFKPGKKANNVRIPSEIINNKKLIKPTIRGIFDTDGCVFFDKRKVYKKPYPRITLQLASIPLINQLEKFLSIEYKLYVNKTNRDGNRNYIEIYGHQQVEKFLKDIGLSNKRHLNRIKNASVA